MTRTSLDHHNCSLARTVDIIGDKWSLMILRDAFYGIRRFSDFKRRLGVTQAVLSARLAHLVDHGVLTKLAGDGAGHATYRLSKKGRELFPVIVGLMQWGDRNIHFDEGPPIELFERSTGAKLDRLEVFSNGTPASAAEIGFKPGPGAKASTIEEYEIMSADQGPQ